MSLEQDIIRILTEYTNSLFSGNKDRAARSLGVQPPTFWRWLKGKNIPKMESLIHPFNVLQARIVLPSDAPPEIDQFQELYKKNLELEKENIELREKVEEFKAYKIKWEGHLEIIRAQSGSSSTPQIKGSNPLSQETA